MKRRTMGWKARGACAIVALAAAGCGDGGSRGSEEVRAPRDATDDGCAAVRGRTVRWIVPYSPGGGYDTQSRLLEPFLEKRLGSEVVVENIPGGGGSVGAKAIMDADPDGLTLGILNAPGLFMLDLLEGGAPNPARDFTVLGRFTRSRYVWLAKAGSEVATYEDLLAVAERRPIVAAFTETGSTSFAGIVLVSELLGIGTEYVAGFPGSKQIRLSLIRGEFDVCTITFESVLEEIESGEIVPILQVSDEPVADHPALPDVPLLGGPDGIAAKRAAARGASAVDAVERVKAAEGLLSAGRLLVGPKGLEAGLAACLEERLLETLNDEEFRAAAAAAKKSLDVASGAEATAELEAAAAQASSFLSTLQRGVDRLRE